MAKVNQIEIQSSLDGLKYPVDKDSIVDYAKENDASQKVIDTLEMLPDMQYSNVAEISSKLKGLNTEGLEPEEDMED